MKKLAFIAAATLVVASFTSCKKDYTCTCKGDNTATTVLPYEGVKKADATDACDQSQATFKLVDATATCTLD